MISGQRFIAYAENAAWQSLRLKNLSDTAPAFWRIPIRRYRIAIYCKRVKKSGTT